jgi:hypothetical protein
VSDEAVKPKYGAQVALHLEPGDTTAAAGKLLAEATRQIARVITTQFAQSPAAYDIDITFTMQEL